MISSPIFALLVCDFLLLAGIVLFSKSRWTRDSLLLSLLFLCSGMPALVYQIIWERALFAIYGVNAESVAVIVSVFILGLGLGTLAGGKLSAIFPERAILIFSLCELGTALFGLTSLRIFHWAARFTAGASLPYTILFSLLLLIVPTMCMGATLPLLVEHSVSRTGRVGHSVGVLYFVNTLGSATACALCASFLLRDFGRTGAVTLAATVNALVAISAFLLAGKTATAHEQEPAPQPQITASTQPLALRAAMLIAGLSGFIALGFEIVWFRVFSLAASDRAPAFALLLSAYLAGVAAGCFVVEIFAVGRAARTALCAAAVLMLFAGGASIYLPPLVATFMARGIPFMDAAPAFFLTAAAIGSVFPLACQLSVAPGATAGRAVSLVYAANIGGSTIGTLTIGFALMNRFGLRAVALQLALAAISLGAAILCFARGRFSAPPAWAAALVLVAFAATFGGTRLYGLLFERLIFATRPEASQPFARVIENRNGVIAVTSGGAVFSGGVYDGNFNVDPSNDSNFVVRPYALSAFSAYPKRVFVIGLASGSWAQVVANNPMVESVDIVEINPGYVGLIPNYAVVRSLVGNPKVHIYTDDARRWLVAHPDARYDAVVANGTFFWRDHASHLLSVEFMQLIRRHLNPGGVYFYNTTESDDAIATGLAVFPYGLRVVNCVAVSDSPILVDKARWLGVLRSYTIDGRPVFDTASPSGARTLAAYMALADSVALPPRFLGMEYADSLHARLTNRLIFTEDNMGWEWRSADAPISWH